MDKKLVFKYLSIISLGIILFFQPILVWADSDYRGKKILFINSYHEGYEWSDGEFEGVKSALAGKGIKLEIIYMDTKNNPSEEYKKYAGIKVKYFIEDFKPDVVISADDNAFKYVIMPYYRDADLPVVFCGINWDISVYNAPYKNTTGMIEINVAQGLFNHLKKFSQGSTAGFLGGDFLSEHKNAKYYAQFIEGGFAQQEYVSDFETWKKKFVSIQEKVDMLVLSVPEGIAGWDDVQAKEFALDNIQIPIGSEARNLMPFILIGMSKMSEEQGEYAGGAALRILDGEKPADIPIITNKKAELYLNLEVAGKLDIVFSLSMLKNAKEILGIKE